MAIHAVVRLGYGFKVTKEMLEELYSRDEDLYMQFESEDWGLMINAYEDDSDFFFGILQGFVGMGYCMEIPTRRNYLHNELMDMIDRFKLYFPEEESYVPKDYILACIE